MGSLKEEGGVNKSYFLGRDEIRRLMTMRSVVVIINLYEHPLNYLWPSSIFAEIKVNMVTHDTIETNKQIQVHIALSVKSFVIMILFPTRHRNVSSSVIAYFSYLSFVFENYDAIIYYIP